IATENRYAETNLRVLQSALALDEQATIDLMDNPSPQSADIARLDAKMNLLLDMVGRLLAQSQPRPPALQIRFNIHGAPWTCADGHPFKMHSDGVFEIHLNDCLVDPLRMIGRVVGSSDDSIDLEFDATTEAIANLLEKYIFRRHRRQVADAK